MPDRIAFSGTGSKILDILTPKNPPLADLAKLIFEAVYEQPYSETGLDILREPEPKEATSKGGLKMPGLNFTREDDGTLEKKMDDLKTVLWGTTQHRLVTKGDTYQTIDDAVLEDVAAEVRAFVELLFGLDFGFGARFGVNEGRMQEYKSMLLKNLLQNVADGWQLRRETLDNPNARLDETLFFYPLVGALNQLSFAIAQ